MPRTRRIVAVTALLVALGTVAGALAGALAATSALALSGLPWTWGDVRDLGAVAVIGVVFGAPLGAVLLPLAGWLLMRRVRLGRALGGTVLGTVAGGLVGWIGPVGGTGDVLRSLAAAVAGFVVAALLLRRSAARGATTAAALRSDPVAT